MILFILVWFVGLVVGVDVHVLLFSCSLYVRFLIHHVHYNVIDVQSVMLTLVQCVVQFCVMFDFSSLMFNF